MSSAVVVFFFPSEDDVTRGERFSFSTTHDRPGWAYLVVVLCVCVCLLSLLVRFDARTLSVTRVRVMTHHAQERSSQVQQQRWAVMVCGAVKTHHTLLLFFLCFSPTGWWCCRALCSLPRPPRHCLKFSKEGCGFFFFCFFSIFPIARRKRKKSGGSIDVATIRRTLPPDR